MTGYNFYCTIKDVCGNSYFPKNYFNCKKHPVTSTTFLLRDVEQIAVYQLLPNLAALKQLG